MRLICTSSFSGLHRAIHRISCFRLFAKLFAQKVSLYILLCLSVSSIGTQIWHVMTNVKWENETSRDFRVPPVIKQGGKNSLDLKKNLYRRFSCNPCRRIRILLLNCQKKEKNINSSKIWAILWVISLDINHHLFMSWNVLNR